MEVMNSSLLMFTPMLVGTPIRMILNHNLDTFTLNGATVSWRSAKQSVVAISSTESENIAASEASQEAIWMKEFITEIGVVPSALDPMSIYCDNIGAIAN